MYTCKPSVVNSVLAVVVREYDVCSVVASGDFAEVALLDSSVVGFEVTSDVTWDEICDVSSDVVCVEVSEVAKGVAVVDATTCIVYVQ